MSALRKCGLDNVADIYKKPEMPQSQVKKDVSDEATSQGARTKGGSWSNGIFEKRKIYNPPKLNIQEVQGALSSRPKRDPGLVLI